MKLYKYVDIDTGKLILENQSLKISKASTFNDPFDKFIEEIYPEDTFRNVDKNIETFVEKLKTNIEFVPSDYNDHSKLQIMRKKLENLPYDQEVIWKKQMSKGAAIQGSDAIVVLTLNLIKNIFDQDGVICFSKTFDNIPMWSHYSDQHRGIVIGFAPNNEKDSYLKTARDVVYSDIRPLLYHSYEDFLEKSWFKDQKEVLEDFVNRISLTKSSSWSFENECRIIISGYLKRDVQYRFVSLFENEIDTIFFGCRVAEEQMKEVVEIAKEKDKNTRFFKMILDKHNYLLHPVEFFQ